MTNEAYLPQVRPRVRRRMADIRGLDRRPGLHPGYLAEGYSVDPRQYPDLAPFPALGAVASFSGRPLSIHSVAGDLFIFTEEDGSYYLTRRGKTRSYRVRYPNAPFSTERQLVQFNHYDGEDVLSGYYRHLCIIYPDQLCFDLNASAPTFERIASPTGVPALSLACVHVSRLFGAQDDRIYASAYNAPANWNLDTATDTGAAAAWASTVQANPLSTGGFTALAVYDSHVLAFKKNFCHIINNTQNPFRIADLLTVGASSQRTVATVGNALFFADDRRIYRYNGDTAEPIGDLLNLSDLSGAFAAAAGDLYYIYVPSENRVFLWSEKTRAWGDLGALPSPLLAMTATDEGCYLLFSNGSLKEAGVGAAPDFRFFLAPVFETGEGEVRFSRLYLTLSSNSVGRLSVRYIDSRQRWTPLLRYRGTGSRHHLVSRIKTPADRGGQLVIEGTGRDYRIHEISLATSDNNN